MYTYISVLDKIADDKHTIANVLSLVSEEFNIGSERQHLVVTGNAKVYTRLLPLKIESGNALSWLIPYVGDWHGLKNAQPVSIKIYYDAGLKQVANFSGHRG